jgi:hypothetical protein
MNQPQSSMPKVSAEPVAMVSPDARRASLREMVTDALRYWEPRRIIYNGALAMVVIAHFLTGLPQSMSNLTFNSVLFLFLLAVLANACYCAAYLADLFAQFSGFRTLWLSWRHLLLALGIAFAAVLTHFFALGFFAVPFNG